MPKRVWLYLTALLYYHTSASCMALAESLQTASHDGLTRLLQASWSGPTLLDLAWRTLFAGARGDLIVDDTVLPKPFATAIEGLAWLYSSQERKPGYGLSLVLLVWTNGSLRVPVGIRLWRRGGASQYALALELLSYARNRLRWRPEYVLFDAWYPPKALLKRLRDYGWYFVCRLKKNRRFNGQAVRQHRRHPY
jgi:putative transposase